VLDGGGGGFCSHAVSEAGPINRTGSTIRKYLNLRSRWRPRGAHGICAMHDGSCPRRLCLEKCGLDAMSKAPDEERCGDALVQLWARKGRGQRSRELWYVF
jgi:hypothetical protein